MRFAFKTSPQHTTWADMLAVWKAADDIDIFESGWTFDHFYPIVGDTDGPCLEGWLTLTALAQATRRIRIGNMVTGIHYRHPAVLANMASTLDIISGGRLELGIGAGWNEQESGAYGIELGTPRERSDRFEEACEVLVGLLRDETTDFDGKFYQLSGARNEPKGPQRPHPPIVIGGSGEKRTLRTVARFAQHWNFGGSSSPDEFPHKRDVLYAHCEAVGRDPEGDPDLQPRPVRSGRRPATGGRAGRRARGRRRRPRDRRAADATHAGDPRTTRRGARTVAVMAAAVRALRRHRTHRGIGQAIGVRRSISRLEVSTPGSPPYTRRNAKGGSVSARSAGRCIGLFAPGGRGFRHWAEAEDARSFCE